VLASLDLTPGSWDPLPGGITSDDGAQRTVTVPAASEAKKFHTVEIVKP